MIAEFGDAELIAGLSAVVDASGTGRRVVPDRYVGSIEKREVATFAEEIPGGGKNSVRNEKRKCSFSCTDVMR